MKLRGGCLLAGRKWRCWHHDWGSPDSRTMSKKHLLFTAISLWGFVTAARVDGISSERGEQTRGAPFTTAPGGGQLICVTGATWKHTPAYADTHPLTQVFRNTQGGLGVTVYFLMGSFYMDLCTLSLFLLKNTSEEFFCINWFCSN